MFRQKAIEWLKRYGPIELGSLAMSLVVAHGLAPLYGQSAAAAIAASIAAAAYYAFNAVREFVYHYRQHRKHRKLGVVLAKTARDVAVEFGIGGAMDLFVTRPYIMIQTATATPWLAINIIVGKLLADALYYTVAIAGYEFKKKRWRSKTIRKSTQPFSTSK